MKIYNINQEVIFDCDLPTLKESLEYAVTKGATLDGANLTRATLDGANLTRATLDGANLTRATLYGATLDGANLTRATLDGATLYGATLYGATLYGANLTRATLDGANLYGANLTRATLDGANLNGANLNGANLDGAKGINKYRTTPLYLLFDQIATIRAYKLVDQNSVGPWNGGIVYRVGQEYEVADADTDENNQCGPGINLATLNWCMREWCEGYRILIAEFVREDIAAIPVGSDGKFRVKRCKIVGEKDLKEIGIVMGTEDVKS